MKTLITVVSSLLVGLSLASSNFSPIHELQHFLNNKRRIFYSIGIAFTGYLLVFFGLLISLVEGALQYDVQGFLMWSSLFTIATGLAVAGVFSLIIAKLMVPAHVEQHESIFRELNKQFGITEGIEVLLKRIADSRDAERDTRAQQEDTSFREEKFSEPRRAPEPVFRNTPTADVLHH